MIPDDGFTRELERYLSARAGSAPAGYLDEALAMTAPARQRRWWASLERWLPLQPMASARVARSRGVRLVVVAAVLAALVALALAVIGSRPRVPPPFGLARNGALAFSEGGDIWRLDPVTLARTPIVTGPTYDIDPVFSGDGTKLLFLRVETTKGPNTSRSLMIANADGSDQRAVVRGVPGLDSFDWAPDARRVLYQTRANDGLGRLNVLDTVTGSTRTIDTSLSVESLYWRPPDGDEIVFDVGNHETDHTYAIKPDGSGLRMIDTENADCTCVTTGTSPDGSTLLWTKAAFHGHKQVVVMNATTGAEMPLPQPLGDTAMGGSFSPDGSLVAYVRIYEPQAELYALQAVVAKPDGVDLGHALGPVIQLLPTNRDNDSYGLAFTPDGKGLLADFGDVEDPDGTASTLWLLPIDGSPPTKLGHGPFAAGDMQRLAP